MRVLVCGGRHYNDFDAAKRALDALPVKPSIIIEGGAKGGDRMGRLWAEENGIHYATVPALWNKFGRAAGFKRNEAMLLLKPQYCVAFPGGRGTASMIELCTSYGVIVWRPYNPC